MPASDETLARAERLLDGATLLGAELETRYRVLGLTVEPSGTDAPTPDDDRRVQVLFHPCAEVTALLLRTDTDEPVVERFDQEQLPDVVAAMDGPRLRSPIVTDPPAPRFPAEVSMHGASSAPDGRTHRVLVDVAGGARRLVLTASYDDLELRGPDGDPAPGG